MKKTKSLIIGVIFILSACLGSCDKEDFNEHSLDNTHWISQTFQNSDYCWSLSFNNGYVQKFRLDPQTHQIRYLDYTAEYKVKGDKLIIYVPIAGDKIEPFEATYKKGIIYLVDREYYLQ
ncbi:MAG: hypothetical protein VB090_05110 [Petrimonas sp.]|nr:hypothetical protein [Petrimonas sp.]